MFLEEKTRTKGFFRDEEILHCVQNDIGAFRMIEKGVFWLNTPVVPLLGDIGSVLFFERLS
ncbi:hypothetical protein VQ01_09165 [Tamlana sp. s12]|nr:hypothetical protein VQ01_09165 [Tamlana sp. s12]